jgi:YhhN family
VLFYLSDVTVALDRFVTGRRFVNRAIGLPLYYGGQFLLAYSIGA